jgi:hypothetical protein
MLFGIDSKVRVAVTSALHRVAFSLALFHRRLT